MGRAGAGSAGGHHASSGGHSSGRTTGGHQSSFSGSHRAGTSGGSSNMHSSMGGPGMPPPRYHGGPGMPPPPPRYRSRSRRYYSSTSNSGTSSGVGAMVAVIIVFAFILIFVFALLGGTNGSTGKSTIAREKLETKNAYINDCIQDEIGWFENETKTEKELQDFWEETGVQPYIILKKYDAALTTEQEKEQWAADYYDANFDTENIFLYVYFAEQNVDGDVGYMANANGYQTSSVMDAEAMEIFWNNIDKYWYDGSITTDEVFIKSFKDTGHTIMRVSTTGKDVVKWVLIVVALVIVGVTVTSVIRMKNQRAKEKAEEDQRILNTPISDIAKDNLEDKYL